MSTRIAKTFQREKPVSCARATARVISAPACDAFEPVTRKLSKRDSEFLVQHLSRPTKPNAALKAAARKYWASA